jgi:hypothetical protein
MYNTVERTITGKDFYGHKISDYGIESGYVDYKTLASCFDAVMINDITKLFYTDIGGEFNEPEIVNGSDYDDERDTYADIYQYFIIDNWGVELLQNWTDEIVYYLPALDCYVWGVTHWGTSWDYVLTDIQIVNDDENGAEV